MSLHLSVAGLLAATLWFLAIDLGAWALGHLVYFGLKRRAASLSDVALALVLGLTLMGTGCLALLLLDAVYTFSLALLVTVPAALGIRLLANGNLPRAAVLRSLRQVEPLTLGVAGLVLAYLPNCYVPYIEHDSLTYHLTFPDLYLRNHGFSFQPYNLNVNMPHYLEVLFTPAALFGGVITPTLLMWQFVVLSLVGIRSLARYLGMPFLTAPAALLYVASPAMRWHFANTYIEPALGCLMTYAVALLLRWRTSMRPSSLICGAWLLGWMFACKYTLWYMTLGISLSALWVVYERRRYFRIWLPLYAKALLAASAALGPWLIRQWVVMGNPVYPNARAIFGSSWWSEVLDFQTVRKFSYLPLLEADGRWLTTLNKPWYLVNHPEYYMTPAYSGALFTMFLLALFLPRNYRGGRRFIVFAATISYLGWALVPTPANEGRYLAAAVPLMALQGALSLSALRRLRAGWNLALAGLAMTTLGFLSPPNFEWLRLFREGLDPVFRSVNPTIGWNEEINRQVPKDAKLLFMFEHRTLGLLRDRWFDTIYEGPLSLQLIRDSKNGLDAAERLKKHGITHLVLNRVTADQCYFSNVAGVTQPGVWEVKDLAHEREVFDQMLTWIARPAFNVGEWEVYKLPGSP